MDNTFTATGIGPTSGVYDIDILASGKILVGGGLHRLMVSNHQI